MRILFAGTSEIGIPAFRALTEQHELVGLLTQPDRPAGRHHLLTAPAMKECARKTFPSLPLFQPENLRDASVMAELRALNAEVIVTMSYGKILPRELLELPSIACLNIHTSLLPRHRGATPIQAAILSGDQETGVTIMYMAEGLDTGDILLQKKIIPSSDETAGTLTKRLSFLAPEPLLEALHLLEQGQAPRVTQQEELVTTTHLITRATAAIDASRPAVELERLIRAMNPKPGAHGFFLLPSGKPIALKIFSVTVAAEVFSEKAGSLFLSQDRELLLACGLGVLELHEVQPEGRARMSAAAFVSGYF